MCTEKPSDEEIRAGIEDHIVHIQAHDLPDVTGTPEERIVAQTNDVVLLMQHGWISQLDGNVELNRLACKQVLEGKKTIAAWEAKLEERQRQRVVAEIKQRQREAKEEALRLRRKRIFEQAAQQALHLKNRELTLRCAALCGTVGRSGFVVGSRTVAKSTLRTDAGVAGIVYDTVSVGSTYVDAGGAVTLESTAWIDGFNGGVIMSVKYERSRHRRRPGDLGHGMTIAVRYSDPDMVLIPWPTFSDRQIHAGRAYR